MTARTTLIASFVSISLLIPPFSVGGESAKHKDIRLSQKSEVNLTIVSAAGKPLADQVMVVTHRGNEICRAKSNRKGQVRISGLRPGMHVLTLGKEVVPVRFWTYRSAPPSALHNPAIVAGNGAVRGQYGPMMGPTMGPAMAPVMLATGVTATAIAVVLIGKSSGGDTDIVLPASP